MVGDMDGKGETYVMRAAVSVWKKAADMAMRPVRYAPSLVHSARKPRKKATTAKNKLTM